MVVLLTESFERTVLSNSLCKVVALYLAIPSPNALVGRFFPIMNTEWT